MIGKAAVAVLLVTGHLVVGDIYMHNPRGSNNRADETGRQRSNGNRLFDSQNNARGGYNVGPTPGAMYYYGGSKLRIEWANQHSCGDENNNCNILIQYMCDRNLRDGTTTKRAPVTCTGDCDTNKAFGHHESLNHYEACSMRERNKGIFIADRDLRNKHTAKYTRQNNGGTRYGYECPEERDYYPYFGHSPWKDIAIITNDSVLCNVVRENSQNMKSRWVCTFSDDDWDILRGKILEDEISEPILRLDKESCQQSIFTYKGTTYRPLWIKIPSHGIPPPECKPEQFSRDNHQGNTIGGELLSYTWTVPNINEDHCALRIRYNISTNDFHYLTTDHKFNVDVTKRALGPSEIYRNYDFRLQGNEDVETEAIKRQYVLKANPLVDVFGLYKKSKHFRLRLALNTAQYGRVFQDRSHSFAIIRRPEDIDGNSNIYNLNVRGKRGNIVQVYPAVEYDFVPTTLHTTTRDYVHIQWTGSNRNPGNNAGEGKSGTDRNNIVQLRPRPYAKGQLGSNLTFGTNYPMKSAWDQNLFGAEHQSISKLALAGVFEVGETPGVTLDDGEPYFDFGLLRTHTVGKHYFFSSRNNNFSNRDQKAQLITEE